MLLVVFCVFAGNDAFAKKPIVEIPNDNIIVLQPSDPVPENARELKTIAINGNNPTADCSYFEIMETAKNMARSLDANVIKITKRVARSSSNDCDAIDAVFYKVADTHVYSDKFQWNKSAKLTWNDFRGPVPYNAGENTAAATYCGIGFETNTVTDNNDPKIFVYNTFYSNQSWVRPDERTPTILKHEQGHFDICELYTRIMKQRMSEADVNAANLKSTLEHIYETVNAAYERCQQQYEQETAHGTIDSEQSRWSDKIAAELNTSEKQGDIAAAF